MTAIQDARRQRGRRDRAGLCGGGDRRRLRSRAAASWSPAARARSRPWRPTGRARGGRPGGPLPPARCRPGQRAWSGSRAPAAGSSAPSTRRRIRAGSCAGWPGRRARGGVDPRANARSRTSSPGRAAGALRPALRTARGEVRASTRRPRRGGLAHRRFRAAPPAPAGRTRSSS